MVSLKELVSIGLLATACAVMALPACVTVDDQGGGKSDEDDDDTSSGNGSNAGSGSGPSSGSGSSGAFYCCLNADKYSCPDKPALDKCIGFDLDGCVASCAPDDFACVDGCFAQLETATPDPSSCTPDPSADCGGSSSGSGSGSGSGGGGSACSDILSGCDYDDDCCSNNCTGNTCWGNSFGDPCEYDDDCDSNNCFDGECQ